MYFVEYYHKGAVTGELIPACGDRSIIILDGRNSIKTMHSDAVEFNGIKRPVYDAYTLNAGETLCRSKEISALTLL